MGRLETITMGCLGVSAWNVVADGPLIGDDSTTGGLVADPGTWPSTSSTGSSYSYS